MSDEDEMEFEDEDISSLEDNPSEDGIGEEDIVVAAGQEMLGPDTPIYRLRLFYSHDTFLAFYKGDPLNHGDMVMVPTRYGRDLAQVIGRVNRGGNVSPEIALVERLATAEDLEKARRNRELETEAFRVCREKIDDHRLDMKLVSVHYLLEEPKILFFFTAENRVDFRELVKDLVAVFKTRIELRQIGVRDEARVLGGLGVCGRAYCCNSVSDKLRPVSIKMAKDQNLSLNSMKISGPCGRLLCCLSYEHNFYSEQRRLIPQEGARLSISGETWKVVEVNVVSGRIKLSAEDGRVLNAEAGQFERVDNRWTYRAAE